MTTLNLFCYIADITTQELTAAMSIEPKNDNDTNSESHAGIMLNWPSAFMLVLWLLVALGFPGIEYFSLLNSPIVLGIILIAAAGMTAWCAFRFFNPPPDSNSCTNRINKPESGDFQLTLAAVIMPL